MKLPPAPRGLQRDGRRFWRSLQAKYEFEADEMVMLEGICRMIDELAALEALEPQLRVLDQRRRHRLALDRLLKSLALPEADRQGSRAAQSAGRALVNHRWSHHRHADATG
jgi:hypothetical protein